MRQVVTSGEISSDPVPITSVTKTVTAAMVLQLVNEGHLTLDGPLPVIPQITDQPSLAGVTVRHLLNHSSGLVPYQQAERYRQTKELDAASALAMAVDSPLEWSPGSRGGYSNSGYLLLGTIIEHITGSTYQDALLRRVTGPIELHDTSLDQTPRLGWVGGAAGGLTSTLPDLLSWGDALYRKGQVLTPETLDEMVWVDPQLSAGLGAFPICPCRTLADGSLSPDWIGHNGGSVTLQYAPTEDLVVAISMTESFWTEALDQSDVHDLLRRVRASATETPDP